MFPKEFENFIVETHKALMAKNPYKDHKVHALGRTTKLAEEFGELAGEVLSSLELQRKSKLAKAKKVHLENEWADTFFSLILLAITLEIPINEAIEKRMSTISQRIKKRSL